THPAELERLLHLARAPPATHTDPSTRRSARRGKPHDRLTLRTHRHVARHGCDSSEPVTHVRVRREVELALLATVCVAEEGDVDERRRVADEPVAPIAKVALHRRERLGPTLPESRQPLLVLGTRELRVRDQEPSDRKHRLGFVLLEEHPLQHTRPIETVLRHEASSLAEVPENRARLAETATVVEHERRDAQRRVQPAEGTGPVRSVDDVELAALVRDAEVREQQPHLVTVA